MALATSFEGAVCVITQRGPVGDRERHLHVFVTPTHLTEGGRRWPTPAFPVDDTTGQDSGTREHRPGNQQ